MISFLVDDPKWFHTRARNKEHFTDEEMQRARATRKMGLRLTHTAARAVKCDGKLSFLMASYPIPDTMCLAQFRCTLFFIPIFNVFPVNTAPLDTPISHTFVDITPHTSTNCACRSSVDMLYVSFDAVQIPLKCAMEDFRVGGRGSTSKNFASRSTMARTTKTFPS